jgi:hypothetical protein
MNIHKYKSLNDFNVNSGQSYANTYFLLTRDLTGATDTVTTVIGNSDSRYFICGIFDGGGYEIAANISVTENEGEEYPILMQNVFIALKMPEVVYGDMITLNGSSNNTVTSIVYTSSDPNVAEISDNLLIAKRVETVTITASQAANNEYFAGESSVNITIQKRNLLVTPKDTLRTYGDANPVFTFSYSEFVNGDTEADISSKPLASTIANINSNAGTYAITCSGGSATNYNFTSYGAGALTVTKAPLTITANNASRKQGAKNPTFTLAYSGFKNNEYREVLDYLPDINCDADENSPAGFYDIVLSGGYDNNYAYELVNGVLEVIGTNSIEDIATSGLLIYPNPAKNDLFIQSDFPIERVELYTQTGVLVKIETDVTEKIDVSPLADGLYLARIYSGNQVIVRKVIVKK